MKTLNLVDIDKSDIKYQIQKFPDGQQNIVVTFIEVFGEDNHFKPVLIKSRLNNWLDLELLVCAVASLRELGVEEIHLYTPYIMGARSDRKFEEGGNNYLRDVICPIINSLDFKTVTCIDPHSDVLEACIKRFKKESNFNLVDFALREIMKINCNSIYYENKLQVLQLVSPDAGASKKIYKLAEQIGYKGDVITCSKDRDADGKLTKTVVPFIFEDGDKRDIIIIDDICDGGATFINIAKYMRDRMIYLGNGKYQNKIYLIVTHGIFSKGFEELSQYFDGIYCTNSYRDLKDDYKTFPDKLTFNKVKQLNVF